MIKTIKPLLFFVLALVFVACNDDDDGNNNPTPEASGDISATIFRISSTGLTQEEWSLPIVNATIDFDNFIITAKNNNTGERLVFTLPPNLTNFANISNTTSDPTLGFATWKSAGAATQWSSLDFPSDEDHDLSVFITAVDTAAKTFDASFAVSIYNPNDSTNFVSFASGMMSNVPYVEDFEVNIGGGTMSWVANGTAITPTSVLTASQGGVLSITGTASGTESLIITLPTSTQSGTAFDLSDMNVLAGVVYTTSSGDFLVATSGTINISSNDTGAGAMNGTFSFEAEPLFGGNTTSVTQGTFSVTY